MSAIASIFDRMTLLVTRRDAPGEGGIPVPPAAEIVILRSPKGQDFKRKLFVLAHLPEYLSDIARHMKHADVVHVPPPGDIPLLGMLVGLALRKRLLVRYCGSWLATAETTTMNRVTRALMRFFAGRRNVMLATGIGSSPPAPRMNWVFATAATREEVSTLQPDLDRTPRCPLRLVYAGRLSHVKGVSVLVEALNQLRLRNPKLFSRVELVVAGDGDERNALEKAVRTHGLFERVRFAGQLDRSSLVAALSQADICVVPSLSESFCKARVDAMLCGTPVLTTEVGFGREIVGSEGERGWVVRSGNATELARALERVAEQPIDWPALRRRCRAFAEQLTLEAWALRIGEICAAQWNVDLKDGKLAL